MAPKVTNKGERPTGVLQVDAAARATATPTKAPTARLKLEIRRLPPSLTLTEFEETVGEAWKLGKGKVDWREYRQGKLKSPGKVPEQSRCYMHLVNEASVREFEQTFLSVIFHDKAGTYKNPDLKHLPPTLGYAPSQRTPLQVKQRADNRQGMIDQDAEFIAFLEAETQPIAKPTLLEVLGGDKEKVVVKSTPLIEDLREKKASKAKAALKRKEDDKKGAGGKEVTGEKASQQKVEQASKDAAKALTKQVAGKTARQQTSGKGTQAANAKKPPQSPKKNAATTVQPPTAPSSQGPAPNRVPPGQRQRANAEGIKKMLQKDLGIRPKATSVAPGATTSTTNNASTKSTPAASTPPPQATPQAPGAAQATQRTTQQPTISTTKAYLKHANPSQGMTEILIQATLTQLFGECTNVTIDPRKGTAIAVFKENEALKKAMEAKRVEVAKGAVEVLEFKETGARRPVSGPVRGGGGFRGRGGGRGGAAAVTAVGSTAVATTTPAPAAVDTPAAPVPTPSAT